MAADVRPQCRTFPKCRISVMLRQTVSQVSFDKIGCAVTAVFQGRSEARMENIVEIRAALVVHLGLQLVFEIDAAGIAADIADTGQP